MGTWVFSFVYSMLSDSWNCASWILADKFAISILIINFLHFALNPHLIQLEPPVVQLSLSGQILHRTFYSLPLGIDWTSSVMEGQWTGSLYNCKHSDLMVCSSHYGALI